MDVESEKQRRKNEDGDDLNLLLTCFNCSYTYDVPIILPCGRTVCFKCIDENDFIIDCQKSHDKPDGVKYPGLHGAECFEKHYLSPQKLITNNVVLELLNSRNGNGNLNIPPTPVPKPVPFLRQHSVWNQAETASHHEYDNINDPRFQDYLNDEMNQILADHLCNVKAKVDLVNTSYETATQKIESEIKLLTDQIEEAAKELIEKIQAHKFVMLSDVAEIKKEILLEYRESYKNPKYAELRGECNQQFGKIEASLKTIENRRSTRFNSKMRSLIEKLEILNAKINDNKKFIPNPDPRLGIVFTKAHTTINMPFIGDISYDSVYKVNMISKINHFNNNFQHRTINMDEIVSEIQPIQKSIDLISKNKFLFLYQKIYGRVKLTSVQIFYSDRTLLYETQIKNVGAYITHQVYNKHLIVVLKQSKRDLIVQVYEIKNLHLIKEIDLDYEVAKVICDQDSVYLIGEKKYLINEYDIELNFKRDYGQKNNPNKPYYLQEEILAIHTKKIFVKNLDSINIIDQTNGLLISSVRIPNIRLSTVLVDFHKEKYLVYNGFNKLSYFNSKGELLAENKLRHESLNFDQFQYSRSGHFGFISTEKNIMVII